MVLIISNKLDYSTNEVIKWLNYYKVNYCRIHSEDEIRIKEIKLLPQPEFKLEVVGKCVINSLEITSYWYRRGLINLNAYIPNSINNLFVDENLHEELQRVHYFLHEYLFNYKKGIGSYLTSIPNKISQLNMANEVGLSIPETLITDNKDALNQFTKQNKTVTKAISDQLHMLDDQHNELKAFVNKVEGLQNHHQFFPSLFQKQISKRYELRIFYLGNTFYAMAIFSQLNKKTEVDFRNYDTNTPNRTSPYLLPENIQKKLKALLKMFNLNSASIDMIVDTQGRYVFLEINPVGQYGMVSQPCNYYLDKKIAKYLMT